MKCGTGSVSAHLLLRNISQFSHPNCNPPFLKSKLLKSTMSKGTKHSLFSMTTC